MIQLEIPGWGHLEIDHVVFDVNGTLTHRGTLVAGISKRIGALRERVELHLASADTFGTLAAISAELGVEAHLAPDAESKLRLVERLGPGRTAHVGNGSNDSAALAGATLGIAVIGSEGASAAALAAADVICTSILDAFDLLLDSRTLAATLRS